MPSLLETAMVMVVLVTKDLDRWGQCHVPHVKRAAPLSPVEIDCGTPNYTTPALLFDWCTVL